MNQKQSIQLFQDSKVRTVWDEEQEKWYFSVVDVVGILVDSVDYQTARNYWKVLKHRLLKEGNEYDYTETKERGVRQAFSPLGVLRCDSEDSAG